MKIMEKFESPLTIVQLYYSCTNDLKSQKSIFKLNDNYLFLDNDEFKNVDNLDECIETEFIIDKLNHYNVFKNMFELNAIVKCASYYLQKNYSLKLIDHNLLVIIKKEILNLFQGFIGECLLVGSLHKNKKDKCILTDIIMEDDLAYEQSINMLLRFKNIEFYELEFGVEVSILLN